MKKCLWSVSLILCLIAPGCVPSVHGIASKDSLTFEPKLLGYWCSDNRKECWRFTKRGFNQYHAVYLESDGETWISDADLVKLKDHYFLDLFPTKHSAPDKGFYLPTHIFMHIRSMTPKLEYAVMDPDGVKKMLKKDPSLIKHEVVDDGILLTAGTKELQAFLVKNVNNPKVFKDYDAYAPMKTEEIEMGCADQIHLLLGARPAVVSSYIRRSIISTKTPYGFALYDIKKGSIADKAGFKNGDILMKWDNKPVKTAGELLKWIQGAKKDGAVQFELSRRKKDGLFSRNPWETVTGQLKMVL